VIEIISARIDDSGFIKIGADVEPGARVLIQAGPFKGLMGVFERKASAADRIRILLDTVYFQAHVEIESKHAIALA
jgi:transcription antitermination factor NusG